MELYELKGNPSARKIENIFSTKYSPKKLLNLIEPAEFEDLTYGWVMEYLIPQKKYIDAVQVGQGKDSGRDIIAYLNEEKTLFDIYQCKRYTTTLSPSNYFCEFGKLCYYTYINKFSVPKNHVLVTNRELGQDLIYYFEHKDKIAEKLVEKWENWCKGVCQDCDRLDEKLKNYILNFNFQIVSFISPGLFLEQVRTTRYYKYYFGGGLPKRETIKNSEIIDAKHTDLEFISQLFKIYSKELGKEVTNQDELKEDERNFRHLIRQYNCYLSFQSLVRFARDQLLNHKESITGFLEQVLMAIGDSYDDAQKNTLARVKETVKSASNASIVISELGDITIGDKMGACHELVNKGEIKWYED